MSLFPTDTLRILLDDGQAHAAGHLLLQRDRLRHMTQLPCKVRLGDGEMPQRQDVEAFIGRIFAVNYGAAIRVTYPVLMGIYDSDDHLLSAMGMRDAAQAPLFLEQYLDAPITEIVAAFAGGAVARHEIVELGNLASLGTGAMKFLLLACTSYLRQAGYRYMVFTGTEFLLRYFTHLGTNPIVLANADPGRLQEESGKWGSYYDTQPKVILGDIHAAHDRLCTMFDAQFEACPGWQSRLHFGEGVRA